MFSFKVAVCSCQFRLESENKLENNSPASFSNLSINASYHKKSYVMKKSVLMTSINASFFRQNEYVILTLTSGKRKMVIIKLQSITNLSIRLSYFVVQLKHRLVQSRKVVVLREELFTRY
jgi:hypothetical protein